MATRTPYTSTALEVLTSANVEKMPKGEVGYATVTANQAGITDTFTDLTGLSVTFTMGADRRFRIYAKVQVVANAALSGTLAVIKDGAEFDRIARVVLQSGEQGTMVGWTEDSPAAGEHTYKLQARTEAAGDTMDMQASASAPIAIARISIDDIGPAFS